MYSDTSICRAIYSFLSEKLERVRKQAPGSQEHRLLAWPSGRHKNRYSGRSLWWIPNDLPTLPFGTTVNRFKDQASWVFVWLVVFVVVFLKKKIKYCAARYGPLVQPLQRSICLGKSHEIWPHWHKYCLFVAYEQVVFLKQLRALIIPFQVIISSGSFINEISHLLPSQHKKINSITTSPCNPLAIHPFIINGFPGQKAGRSTSSGNKNTPITFESEQAEVTLTFSKAVNTRCSVY